MSERSSFVRKCDYKVKCYFCESKGNNTDAVIELALRPITYPVCLDHFLLLKNDIDIIWKELKS